jgi:hypothetical protein
VTVALAILTLPLLASGEYLRHRVASRRHAHRNLHAAVARYLTPGGDRITRSHRAQRRYGEHRAYDE